MRTDLACVADGFQVEAVLQTGNAVISGDAADGDNETIVGYVDALAFGLLALVVGKTTSAESFAVPVVTADDVDFEQTLGAAVVDGFVLAHDYIGGKALDVVSMYACEQLADGFDERSGLDGADGSRGKERVKEIVVVGRDECHIVLFRIERLEQAHGGPTASDDDESLLVGELLADLVLFVFGIGGEDGQVLGTTALRRECERMKGNLVGVRFAVG